MINREEMDRLMILIFDVVLGVVLLLMTYGFVHLFEFTCMLCAALIEWNLILGSIALMADIFIMAGVAMVLFYFACRIVYIVLAGWNE